MTNIRDIAKEAKVSVATVSRFLDPTKKELVHSETAAVIEKIIRKHHYIPNRAARSLSKKTSDTIGMVTPLSTDVVKSPYYEGLICGIIEGIQPLLHKLDLKWVLISDQERENLNLDQLLQEHSVDGLIFLSWRLLPKLVKEMERRAYAPAVLINDFTPNIRSSIVYCENKRSVMKLCSYLIDKGHKKIGMMRGPEYISLDAKERFLAFKASAKKLGFKLRNEFVYECPRFEEEAGYQTMSAWIKGGRLPDAIFCANDDIACGALRALQDRKIGVPTKVAIAGFDDSARSNRMNPPLTTMRQPLEAMGRAAVEILSELISKKSKAPIQFKFEAEVVPRKSA